MKKIQIFLNTLFLSLIFIPIFTAGSPVKMIVSVTVADLRSDPSAINTGVSVPALSTDLKSGILSLCGQVSQLLLGECLELKAVDENNEWLNITTLEQEYLKDSILTPCSGYVQKNQVKEVAKYPQYNLVTKTLITPIYGMHDSKEKIKTNLSIGTKLLGFTTNNQKYKIKFPDGSNGWVLAENVFPLDPIIPNTLNLEFLRQSIVDTALTFLECPYVWGGRSAHFDYINGQITGVDCSALIDLVFRAHGLQIPRNTRAQLKDTNFIKEGGLLQPGDLVFFPGHVMLFLGSDILLHTTGLGYTSAKQAPDKKELYTKITTGKKFLGKPVNEIKNGEQVGKRTISFGSFLNTKKKIQELRSKFIGIK
jgi:cell wall-associated NlpC family hydrolase